MGGGGQIQLFSQLNHICLREESTLYRTLQSAGLDGYSLIINSFSIACKCGLFVFFLLEFNLQPYDCWLNS